MMTPHLWRRIRPLEADYYLIPKEKRVRKLKNFIDLG
tara:strand:- start:18 stop:128 length:111 start_codon:yes stop_codon:yes gene_type:complete